MLSDQALCAIAASTYVLPAECVVAGDVHAFHQIAEGVDIVSFRGTVPTSWADWFRDCAAWPVCLKEHPLLGRCHAGFVGGAEAALPWLRTVLSPERPFVVTGHSLGGALAIAAAALLLDEHLVAAQLTTFGAPRVGWDLGKWLSRIPGRRYRNGDDPVVEVPTWPYRHDRALTDVGLPVPLLPIEDHFMAAYGLALQHTGALAA